MSQHDYNLIDQSGAAFRSDLNLNLQAIAENNSGLTEPTTMFAYQWWADTTSGYLKQRNAANTGWIVKQKLSSDMISAIQKQEFTAFTTAGTSTAYTLTTSPVLAALTTNECFKVTFHTASGAAPTLARDGLTAKLLKQYDSSGAKVTAILATNQITNVQYDGTDYVVLDILLEVAIDNIYSISASVATNALTAILSQCAIKFRSTTLTDGAISTVVMPSSISLTVPYGATLGTVNGVSARLAVIALSYAGTVELAIVNMSGGVNLDESGIISTSSIDVNSDSNTVIYSNATRTNVAYRVVGFIDITEATAGTWATGHTLVQGSGGQALTAMSSLGYGQTWQHVTRTSGVTYYNTTGRAIVFFALWTVSQTGQIIVNGVTLYACATDGSSTSSASIIIPVSASYSYSGTLDASATACAELR